MKLFYSEYDIPSLFELNAKVGKANLKGCLIKLQTADGSAGYADLRPHPGLGDPALAAQLLSLRGGMPHDLAARSLLMAAVDAEARSEGRSLFQGLKLPNTHALMGSLKTCSEESLTDLVHKGYTHAKFKVGLDSQYEAQKLKSWLGDWPEAVKLRLDFNGSLTEEGFHHWLQSFSAESLLHFDFIEDPFEFSKPSWDKIEGVTLALDRALNEQTVSMWSSGPVIIKPAVQDFRTLELASGQRAIFTNYMDHPVGEMFAIYEACQFYSQLEPEVGGLRAFHFFERHSYAEMIEGSGPELNLPAGTGIGFDELLEQESWLPL